MKVFILISCFFIASALAQNCQQDWIMFEESCYGFGEDLVSWGDAQEMCELFGARLAEIETVEENNFLKNMARAKADDWYWLGGTDVFHEGVWRWSSTGEIITSFQDWGPNQPGDIAGQDCLGMYKLYSYQWFDGTCSNIGGFVCEGRPEEVVVG